MSTLSDISAAGLKELALYLKGFPSDDEDADEYWYQLACTLRKRPGNTYRYNEQFLVEVGKAEDKAALVFLNNLAKKGIQLDDFIECLKEINCQQAVQFLQPGATTPEIRPLGVEDQRRTCRAGETLELSVEASCSPGPLRYAWFHNQKPLPGNNSPHLVIQDLTIAHAGTYYCKVTNPSMLNPQSASAQSQLMEVEVKEEELTIVRQETSGSPGHVIPPPVIRRQPTSVQADRGDTVTLYCLAEQCVAYDWYKDGVRLKTGPDGQLVFSHVTCADAGVYHCEVVNDGGKETSSNAILTVGDIKLLEQPPKHQIVRVGKKLCLHCSASSPSELYYEWFLLDKTMTSVKELQWLSNEQTFTPTVTSKNLTSKGRLYFRCKVVDMSDPTNFIYTHIAEVQVQRVWIVEQPSDLQAVIKQRVQLSCTGEGDGQLKYIWLKSATRDGRYEIVRHKSPTSSNVLVFESLGNVDAGYYQCQVECGPQHVDSEIVQVKALASHAVQAKTEPVIKVLRQPRAHVVAEGAPFRLVFEAVCSTSHPLQYQWFFKGSELSGATSSVYACQSASLEDCGSYWCSVKVGEGPAHTLSQAVRVELKFQETQHQGGTWQQREGEQLFRTRSEERFAREKIALLIGNSDYSNQLGRLTTPEHDVAALQKVLTDPALNFKVFSFLDLTHAEMQAALESFYSLLQKVPGTYALFYFSGHGFSTFNQVNFLVPVDCPPEPSQCFQVSDITRKMQDTFSRAILILDACKVLKERVRPDDNMTYSSMGNISNMFELWSCVDSMAASDASIDQWGPHPRSLFNKALTEIISKDKCSLTQIHDYLLEKSRSGSQRPVSRLGMLDTKITLQDPIMMDNQDLESCLDQVLQKYCSAHAVPEAVRFEGAKMKDLNGFAELELSFSLLLTNMLHVGAELVQVHEDKTSKASVQFDTEFVEKQGVRCSQEDPLINGQEEGLCARASLVVRGLQKLTHPLKLLLKVCLWESGQESSADITYKMPVIATTTNCC